MKTINILALIMLILLKLNATAQELASARGYSSSTVLINGSIGIGTFAAGENMGGSAFLGGSLSADWMPDEKTGLSYGLESGLLGGETQGSKICGIPAIFRLGWHPGFVKNENIDIFVLMKMGWAFGIWDSHIKTDASPNGIVGGFNFGCRYFLYLEPYKLQHIICPDLQVGECVYPIQCGLKPHVSKCGNLSRLQYNSHNRRLFRTWIYVLWIGPKQQSS